MRSARVSMYVLASAESGHEILRTRVKDLLGSRPNVGTVTDSVPIQYASLPEDRPPSKVIWSQRIDGEPLCARRRIAADRGVDVAPRSLVCLACVLRLSPPAPQSDAQARESSRRRRGTAQERARRCWRG